MIRAAAVIPAYNEAATIRGVAERTLRELPDTIIVDDGSTDGTSEALAGLPLTLLANQGNRGKGGSLLRGMHEAVERGAEAIVTLDGDGQHRPEDVPRLLAAFERHRNSIIIGSRALESDRIPRDRYWAQHVANFWIGWAARCPLEDCQSGFRVYPAGLVRALEAQSGRAGGFVFESEVLIDAARAGTGIVNVPIAAIYEARGRRSHFRPVIDIALITGMVAWKIVSKGFDFPGLVQSLRTPVPRSQDGWTDR